MTPIDILEALLADLPAQHPERPGVIRSIELLRSETVEAFDLLDPSTIAEREQT